MSKNISQAQVYKALRIPPSRANIQVVGSLPSVQAVNTKFVQMGLTAADLNPIDWRQKISLSPILNQQDCGDCWAMSSTSALTDRFIYSKNIQNLQLDPAVTAQCAQPNLLNQGCGGGQPFLAGQFFENNGVPAVDVNCPAWPKICPAQGSCTLPSCSDLQAQCNKATYYMAKKHSTENLTVMSNNGTDTAATIANIKRELLNGPVVAAYLVPKDFMASGLGYKWPATNGIYINGAYNSDLDKMMSSTVKRQLDVANANQWADVMMEGNSPAGHAVSIVGWDRGNAGSYGNVSYWIVRNSWGPDWNEGGFFRIAMNDGQGLNTILGFDIPVAGLKIPSTGDVVPLGGLFGGCVAFAPDITSGAPANYKYPQKGDHSRLYVILIIIVCVLVAGMIGYFLWKKRGKKRV